MNWLHKQPTPVLHLDLKPSNVLLTEDWTVRIADFGLSRLQEVYDIEVDNVAGTPLYMAPEMVATEPSITCKCDVYAYGILLCEMIAEAYPYNGKYKALNHLFTAVTNGERPDMPSNAPKSLAGHIMQCWDSNPYTRPIFSDILSSDVYQLAVSEAIAGQQNLDFIAMWSNLARNQGVDEIVSCKNFRKAFAFIMRTKEDDKRLMAIHALLDVHDNKGHVTWTKVNAFVRMFGVLQPCGGAQINTLDLAWNLLKKKWFWGELDGDKASQELQTKGKIGSFLVRYSSNRSQFTVSYVKDKSQIKHMCLDSANASTLIEEINNQRKLCKLKTPIPGRPAKFVSLFTRTTPDDEVCIYVDSKTNVEFNLTSMPWSADDFEFM